MNIEQLTIDRAKKLFGQLGQSCSRTRGPKLNAAVFLACSEEQKILIFRLLIFPWWH